MNIQIFGTKKCNNTKKAERFFKERGIKFQFIDMKEKALEILEKYRLVGKTAVYFSPVFGRIQPVEIVDFLMEKKLNDVKLQIQLHKVIWDPQKRGV